MHGDSRCGVRMKTYLQPHSTAQIDATRSSWRGHRSRSGTVAAYHQPSSCNAKRSELIALVSPTRRGFETPACSYNTLRTWIAGACFTAPFTPSWNVSNYRKLPYLG